MSAVSLQSINTVGTLIAAFQHGIATVGTDGHHTDDLLRRENGKALLLTGVVEHEQFVEAVCRLAKDEPLRQELGGEAVRVYDANFAWGPVAAQTLTVLQRHTS